MLKYFTIFEHFEWNDILILKIFWNVFEIILVFVCWSVKACKLQTCFVHKDRKLHLFETVTQGTIFSFIFLIAYTFICRVQIDVVLHAN